MSAAFLPVPELTAPSVEDGKYLSAFLKESGYDPEGASGGFSSLGPSAYRYRPHLLPGDGNLSPLDVLAKWFTCGLPVFEEQARRTVPARVVDLFTAHGALRREGSSLVPQIMITPFEGMLIASDLVAKLDAGCSDTILWPNVTSFQVLNSSLRAPGLSVLELGSGTGVLSVAAGVAGAASLTATDINPRAAAFVRFSARLNGIESIECLTGDAFDPVRGRKFDLILCNPPFYLLPATGLLFSDNPMELDAFVRHLMRSAPEYLNEQGYFQMLCEWAEFEGSPWEDRLREWASGLPCDVLIIKTFTARPADYGRERCDARPGTQESREEAFAQWAALYRDKRVKSIHTGVITLRRRTGQNWFRVDADVISVRGRSVAQYLRSAFARRDLMDLTDEQFLTLRLGLSRPARLRMLCEREDASWTPKHFGLTMSGPSQEDPELTRPVAEFVAEFDGARSLSELVADLAAKFGAPPETVAKECLSIARKLVYREFLTMPGLE